MSASSYSGSGFLSTFTGTLSVTDILSTAVSATGTYGDSGQNNYGAGYFTMGNILIQFTNFAASGGSIDNYGSTGIHIINFPMSFNSTPWCVVASPCTGGQNQGQFTIQSDNIYTTGFKVYVTQTGVGLTYIAIGPGPPGSSGLTA